MDPAQHLMNQFAAMGVGGSSTDTSTNTGLAANTPSSNSSNSGSGKGLKTKRSQRFTVPVHPSPSSPSAGIAPTHHPHLPNNNHPSPPFSNSDESSGAATTNNRTTSSSDTHSDSIFSSVGNGSGGSTNSSAALLNTPTPGMESSRVVGGGAGRSFNNISNSNSSNMPFPPNFANTPGSQPFPGTHKTTSGPSTTAPAFLQHDPFAYSGGMPSGNPARSRTTSTASSAHSGTFTSAGGGGGAGPWSDQPMYNSPNNTAMGGTMSPHGLHQQQQQQQSPATGLPPFDLFQSPSSPPSYRGMPGNSGGAGLAQPLHTIHQQSHHHPPPPPPFNSMSSPLPPSSLHQTPPHLHPQAHRQRSFANLHQPPSDAGTAGGTGAGADDIIPTAIVIKNIPFAFPSTSLLQIIDDLTLAPPYAFNYHYDNGVFRGLAFANFHTPQETDACVAALNGFEIQGRKLRVEYKKVLQAGEKERIERDKAIKRMRSMQLDRERVVMQHQVQQMQQQQQFYPQQPYQQQREDHHHQQMPPPPQQPQQQQLYQGGPPHQQPQQRLGDFSHRAPPPQHQQNDDLEDYGRVIPSNSDRSLFSTPSAYNSSTASSVPIMNAGSNASVTSSSELPTISSSASNSSRVQSSNLPYELDMNDGPTLEIYSRVVVFKEDSFRDELAFSKSLSSLQRRIVHLVAQKLGLEHRSVGNGEERHVVVSKGSKTPPSAGNESQQQQQQLRGLRARASAHHLSPDPYKHHHSQQQPQSQYQGLQSQQQQQHHSPLKKKSMPDLRHQQQHPSPSYSSHLLQQQPSNHSLYSDSGQFNSNPNLNLLSTGGNNGSSAVTPRHSTHDLRSAMSRRSALMDNSSSSSSSNNNTFNDFQKHTNDSIPPVPALPPISSTTQSSFASLPNSASTPSLISHPQISATTTSSTPASGSSATAVGSTNSNNRHSLLFGDEEPALAAMGKAAVTSPIGTPSSASTPNTGSGLLRQPRGPDSTNNWARGPPTAVSSSSMASTESS